MKMYMIAVINVDNKRAGFRILDYDTGKIMDVPEQSVLQVLKSNQQIINLEICNNKIQGSNGDLNRYAKLCNGALQSGKLGPVVVLNQIGENGYTIADHNGKMIKAKMVDVLSYAKNNGIANGKISTRNQTEFISAISGTYEKIDVPPMMISTDYATVMIKPKDTVNKPEKIETVQETNIVLSDIQKSVLKDYYSWAGLESEIANKEIEYLNRIVSENKTEESYICTKLLYEILTKLGSSYTIAEAFGNELATRLVNFMSARLPFTKSIVQKCIDHISADIDAFYKVLFFEMTDGITIITKSTSDTFGLAAKIYLEYMATREILGRYKGFETETDAYNKQFIKEYLLATEFTFTELRAVVGAVDIIIKFGAEVNTTFSQMLLKSHESELFYLSNIYYSHMDNSGITADDKAALIVAIGFNPKYYNKMAAEELKLKTTVIDKTFEKSPHKQYENCLYESSPIGRKQSGIFIPIEKNIEQLYYKQIQVLDKGQDSIMYAFYEFCVKFFRERDSLARDRLQEELRIRNEQAALQRKIDIEQQIKAEKERIKLEEAKRQARENSDMSGYNKIELYKGLKQLYSGKTKDICFSISDDMISRSMKYEDMSRKQKFRLDEAIGIMTKVIKNTSQNSSNASIQPHVQSVTSNIQEENKTYFLNEHPEIKAKVDKLIGKADTVEMGIVIKQEPFVLKICYSIIKYNKASDKQLKHVNNAVELLDKQ